jgi:hypothetical protein
LNRISLKNRELSLSFTPLSLPLSIFRYWPLAPMPPPPDYAVRRRQDDAFAARCRGQEIAAASRHADYAEDISRRRQPNSFTCAFISDASFRLVLAWLPPPPLRQMLRWLADISHFH